MAFRALVGLTMREAVRRRLVLLLLLVTLVAIALSAWGFSRVPEMASHHASLMPVISSELLVLVMFMYSGLLAVGSAFLAATSIAGERESGVSLTILARPLHRSEIFFGKWVGLMALVVAYVVLTCVLEFAVVGQTTGYVPAHVLWAILFLAAEGGVMIALGLLFGSRLSSMTAAILAAALFFLAWLLGVVGGIGNALNNSALIDAGVVSHLLLPTDGLWRGAIFSLESNQVLLLSNLRTESGGNPFFAGAPPAVAYVIWVVIWGIVICGLGALSFARSEM